MEKNIALRREQGRTRYPNKDFSEIKKLGDILRLDDYNHDWTLRELIEQTAFQPDKKHLFYEYVNACSMILHNMMRIPIDIHASFIVLLFPLHQFFLNKANADVYTQVWGYYGKAPLPEDLNGITKSVPRRVENGNKGFSVIHGPPLTMKGMMHLYWLRQPHHIFRSKTAEEIMMKNLGPTEKDDIKRRVNNLIGNYHMADYDSNNRSFQVFDSKKSREIVRQCFEESMKNFGKASYGPEKKYSMRKRKLISYITVSLIADLPEIQQSIDEGYENISKWETCLKLLKAAFLSYKPGNSSKAIIKSNILKLYTNTLGNGANIGKPRATGFTSWGSPPFGFQTALCPYCHNPIVTRWPFQTNQCHPCASPIITRWLYPMVLSPHFNPVLTYNIPPPGLSPEKKAWLDQVISSPDIPSPTLNSNSSLCDKNLTNNQNSNARNAPTAPSQLSSKTGTCLDTASSVSPRNANLASFELTNQRKNVIVSHQLLSESSTRRYSALEKSLINADLASFDKILSTRSKSHSLRAGDQALSSNMVGNAQVQRKRASTETHAIPTKKKSRSPTLSIDVCNISSPTFNTKQPYPQLSGIDDTELYCQFQC
ncbi:hypothetical protein CAEBREN_03207 [Caenorhabditis brenneri]|uniref:Uncharacterized protein n=1 Tax=Caenorhabditis brenneri TaxID=135651 RepID=G0MQX2_CAEBE|nr:hypothetical protein CAEBREN_03207 [Caenorhabditis brenneri]